MIEIHRYDSEGGRFTNIFLSAPDDLASNKDKASTDRSPCLELTYNWDPEDYKGGRNFGHLAYAVDNIHETCSALMEKGVTINRPPRDGHMAFIRSPDGISIELLQKTVFIFDWLLHFVNYKCCKLEQAENACLDLILAISFSLLGK